MKNPHERSIRADKEEWLRMRKIAARKKAKQKLKNIDCIHRDLTSHRRETCPTCKGTVQVKIFACAVFGECTIQKKIGEIATCAGCKSRVAPPPLPSPSPT